MRFSQLVPAMAAGLAGLASATLPSVDAELSLSPASFELSKAWDKDVLFSGVVGVDAETSTNVELSLELVEAQIEGQVSLDTVGEFLLAPVVRLNLEGVKAYFQIDFSATAAAYYTVELVSSGELSIDTLLLDIDLGAAFALDLVVGAAKAVDLSAGFYVSFGAGDFLDISAITKEVVGSELSGIVAQALPVSVGANVDLSEQIEVQFGLRLRSHVIVDAELEVLGLEILDAGAEVAIWVDLVKQTMILKEISECPISIDHQFAFSLGVAVALDLEVLDILDLSLAPQITVELAKTIKHSVCLPGHDDDDPTSTVSASATATSTGSVSSSASVSSDVSSSSADVTSATISTVTVSSSSSGNGTWTTSATSSGDNTATVSASSDDNTATVTASSSEDNTATVSATSVGVTSAPDVTSTVSSTHTYTITSCHASVPNCPADQTQVIVTSTIVSSVTVCPSGGSPTPAPSPSTSKPVHTITETATTVVPCEPTTSTYTPPPPPATPLPPTLTITVCPSTSAPTTAVSITDVPSTEAPTTAVSITDVPTGPIITHPAPNSTWSSVTVPGSTGGIVPTAPPPGATPPPPVAAAGSIRVGAALALPAVVALFL